MVFEPLLTTQLIAGGLTLVLAAWLLWLRFNSALTRAFSLFLFVRAMNILLNQFARLTDDAAWQQVWTDLSGYFVLAVLPALASFLVAYAMPVATRRRTTIRWGLLATVIVVEVVHLTDPCRTVCFRQDGRVGVGPLGFLATGQALAFGAAALWLAWSYAVSGPGPRRRAVFLVAIALATNVVFEVALGAAFIAFSGWDAYTARIEPSSWATLAYGAYFVGLVPALVAVGLLARPPRVGAAGPGGARLVIGLASAAVVLAVAADRLAATDWFHPILGTWRLVLPVIISYALVRHRLFGLEVKLRGSFGGGSVAAAVLATFFLVTELTQAVFEGWSGSVYIGILLAGMLAFVIAPLERVGHRLAHRVVPESRGAGPLTHDERLAYFGAQAQVAWSTGALQRDERMMLDDLRERLGLSLDEAAAIELAVAKGDEVTRGGAPGAERSKAGEPAR